MLQHAYERKDESEPAKIARSEVGRKYWGSRGPYVRKNMILGLIEEMGHEYDDLLEGAMAEEEGVEEGPDKTAMLVANETIIHKSKTQEELDAEEDAEEDDEEEEWGEEQKEDDDNDDES